MSEPSIHRDDLQLLGCEFEIRTNAPELLDWIRLLAPHPQHDVPIDHREIVSVTWTGEVYRIAGDSGAEEFELSLTSLVDTLLNRLNARAIAGFSDHIRVRAACGTYEGRSFLIAGPSRSGKTVLAVRLLLDGLDITGDELVLLRDRSAVPFPRQFQLGEDSVALLPELASLDKFAEIARHPRAERLVPLDPREFGRPWRIGPAPVAALFYLDPNFGASRTRLLRSAKVEMLRRLLPHCAPPPSRRRNWLADLSATVDQADTFVVTLGDLPSASTAIRQTVGRLAGRSGN